MIKPEIESQSFILLFIVLSTLFQRLRKDFKRLESPFNKVLGYACSTLAHIFNPASIIYSPCYTLSELCFFEFDREDISTV